MKGLIVPLDNNNLKAKANKFSRLLLKLRKPHFVETDTTTHYFDRVKHPTLNLGAMLFDEAHIVPFRLRDEQGDYRPRSLAIIEELVDLLYTNATDAKKDQIRNYVKNNSGATVEQILPNTLPSGVEIKTYTEMTTDGWFPNLEE